MHNLRMQDTVSYSVHSFLLTRRGHEGVQEYDTVAACVSIMDPLDT